MSERLTNENRHSIISFLQCNFQNAKTINKDRSSYGLKHMLQTNKGYRVDWYVTEEEFTDLMTEAGYKSEKDNCGITKFYITESSADRAFKVKNGELRPRYIPSILKAVEEMEDDPVIKRLTLNKDEKNIFLDGKRMESKDTDAIIKHFRDKKIKCDWIIQEALIILARENTPFDF